MRWEGGQVHAREQRSIEGTSAPDSKLVRLRT
jgi:hypothetical protein